MTTDTHLLKLADRFAGLDLQHRRDWQHYRKWTGPWRARMIANKNERAEYRITVYGTSPIDVLEQLVWAVAVVDA